MQLKKATITNYKGITHAEIPFTKHMVLLQGKNGSGKSSLIDGILSCLGGKDSNITEPIKHGEKKAENVIEFDEGTITRTFTEKGNSIKLVFKDGKEIRGIGKIAEYIGCSSFDPMAFTHMNPAEQRELILKVSGVDLTEADKAIAEAEEKRLELGRIAKSFQFLIVSTDALKHSNEEEVSVVKLSEELQKNNEIISEYNNYKEEKEKFVKLVEEEKHKISIAEENIKEYSKYLEKIEDIKEPEDNRETLKKQMETAEYTNNKIREYREYDAKMEEKSAAAKAHQAQDKVVDTKREDKAALLKDAKMPVAGLSVTDEGVTFEGIPYKQINTAKQILIGVKIALSDPANKLKFVYIEKGSELDNDSIAELQALVDMCRAGGVKVNILIGQAKDEPQENGFFLEEGQIVL